jgi:hypothetical protein
MMKTTDGVMTIKRVSAKKAKTLKGATDWRQVDALDDKAIEDAARKDPDSALPTPDELKEFRRVGECGRAGDGENDK